MRGAVEVERWMAPYEALLADPDIDVVYIPAERAARRVDAASHRGGQARAL
jgi:predicted dehydrogenase